MGSHDDDVCGNPFPRERCDQIMNRCITYPIFLRQDAITHLLEAAVDVARRGLEGLGSAQIALADLSGQDLNMALKQVSRGLFRI